MSWSLGVAYPTEHKKLMNWPHIINQKLHTYRVTQKQLGTFYYKDARCSRRMGIYKKVNTLSINKLTASVV
jgi:hypothetical protein